MSDPHQPIKVQNKSLQNGLLSISDYYDMENRQLTRKTDTLPILGYINSGLILLYAVVYFVLLLVLFIKAKSLSIYIKLVIIAVFALYPFFIYTVENAAFQMYYYVYSIIYGQSYQEIMARKGIQNPKNFRDAKDLEYVIQTNANQAIDQSAAYMKDLQTRVIDLESRLSVMPDAIKLKFKAFMLLLPYLPDNMQLAYIDMQNKLIAMYNDYVTAMPTDRVNAFAMVLSNLIEEMKQVVNDFLAQLSAENLPSSVMKTATEKVTQIRLTITAQLIQVYSQYIAKQFIPADSPVHTPTQVDANKLRTSGTYTFTGTTSTAKFLPLIYDYQDDMNDTIKNMVDSIQSNKTDFATTISNYSKTIGTIHTNVLNNIKTQATTEGVDVSTIPKYTVFSSAQAAIQNGLTVAVADPKSFGGLSDDAVQQAFVAFDTDYMSNLANFQTNMKATNAVAADVIKKYQPLIQGNISTLSKAIAAIATISDITKLYIKGLIDTNLTPKYSDANIAKTADGLKTAVLVTTPTLDVLTAPAVMPDPISGLDQTTIIKAQLKDINKYN